MTSTDPVLVLFFPTVFDAGHLRNQIEVSEKERA